MAINLRKLKKGAYYQIGEPIIGILKFQQFNVPKALVYGEFLDIKTGGLQEKGVKAHEIIAEVSIDRVNFYRHQFIKGLLDY